MFGHEKAPHPYLALKRAGIPAELHIFANGSHDFGVRPDARLAASWMELCVKWLRSFEVLPAAP